MNKGSILQIGSPEEVMNHPINEFVASFVGIETILSGKVVKKKWRILCRLHIRTRDRGRG